MTSRPQFSLRMLMFVTVMVCLAAATLNEPPEGEQVMRGAQGLLRAVLCVTLAAALAVGAMRTDGYTKTFYIGSAAAAALPLFVLVETVAGSWQGLLAAQDPGLLPGCLLAGIEETSPYRCWLAKWWASVPVFGLAAVGLDRLFQVNAAKDRRATLTPRRFFTRGALFVLVATCLAAIAAMPAPGDGRLALTQSWLAEALCVFFAAMFAVGAVQASGYFKTFFVGGLLPALLAVVWLYVSTMILVAYDAEDTASLSQRMFALVLPDGDRLTLAAHWAVIPVLGTAFVLCDWLFERAECRSKRE